MIKKLRKVCVSSHYSGRRCPENDFYTDASEERIKRLEYENDFCSDKVKKLLLKRGYVVAEVITEVFISSRQ